jgi:hypothetical protein
MKSTPKSAKSPSPSKSVIIVTLSQFRAEYQKADDFCQEVTSFVDEAGIPALNELRNAGHHLLRALDDGGNVIEMDDLIAARNHARRASYEACEAGNLFALGIIAKFKEDYATIPVDGTVPDYTGLLKKAKAAQKSVEQGRQNGFDRADDHTVRIDAFRKLRECAETLELAREEMNKKIDPASVARKTLWIAIFGIIVAIAIAIWTAFNFWPLNRAAEAPMSTTRVANKARTPVIADQKTSSAKQAERQ